jgi:NADH:ubiquinone oxidoreductase subunit F (NADH-binding)
MLRYGRPPLPRRGDGAWLVECVEQAGLTGRGGAAFPTGRKLRTVAQSGAPAVVVANGMESEPASSKDETLLTVAPHLVLDGISLAAAAVGAGQAHLCLPRDRPRLAETVAAAVDERRRHGVDPLPIEVHDLPAHYVSSEETSLVQWLNGGEARPLSVPPRPFERGVDGLPTLVDNVETLAHLALIARYGPAWFRSVGMPGAPGTTLVTLAGAVATPGVYEVELGSPVGEVLALGNPPVPLQAVLLGGFFGSWLPAEVAVSLPYSAPAIAAAGGGIGAGVVLALPSGSCGLAETARVLHYLAAEGAGQCGPCRFGLPATAADFASLAWQDSTSAQQAVLEEHIWLLAGRGACKHPDGASRLAASALYTFDSETREHLTSGPCPAARSSQHSVLPVPPAAAITAEDWR